MGVFIVFLIAGCCVYTASVVMLLFALCNVRSGSSSKKPYVSVVIAARNERDVIGACLASIMKQDYPGDCYEVIVADDRSVDGTTEVLKRFQAAWNHFRVVRIDRIPEGVSPKKHALSQAINRTRGEIILQTDADCIVPVSWISGMIRGFGDGVGMVAGLAPYLREPGALNSFARHEYLWNAALASGSIALGHGSHASGRNLGFRREVFEHIGGYGTAKKVLSGDDTLLLHSMRKFSDFFVVTMPDVPTHVYTRAPEDFGTFMRQRIRHMSTGRFFDPFLVSVGCAVYGFHILLMLSLFFSIGSLKICGVFAGVFLWKTALDGLAAWRIKTVLGLDVQWKRFVINELILMVYMAIIPLLGLFVPVIWKEKY